MMETKVLIVGAGAFIVGVILSSFVAPQIDIRSTMPSIPMMRTTIDRHFIEQMIPHHEGAIAMAELALEKSTRPEVRGLAEDITEAQTKEIEDMTTWYEAWYGRSPSTVGHGMMHMEGMEGDLDALQSAADFDEEFLSQMIVHHEMAIMMAQMLEAGTERAEMKTLAEQIITSQSSEIETMEDWLKMW